MPLPLNKYEKYVSFKCILTNDGMEALNVQIINPQAKLLLFDLENMNLMRIEVKSTDADAVRLREDLKNAAQDVRLHKQGKLKLKTAQELLNEL